VPFLFQTAGSLLALCGAAAAGSQMLQLTQTKNSVSLRLAFHITRMQNKRKPKCTCVNRVVHSSTPQPYKCVSTPCLSHHTHAEQKKTKVHVCKWSSIKHTTKTSLSLKSASHTTRMQVCEWSELLTHVRGVAFQA